MLLDRLGPPGLGGALTSFVTLARARELFLNSQCRRDAARPARAAWAVQRLLAAAATLSATGSASPRPDRTSWPGGLRRAFSPAFRAGSLYPLARGCRRIWRGVKWLTLLSFSITHRSEERRVGKESRLGWSAE